MVSLLLSLAVLVIGYLVYGRLTEKVFGPDDRQTPAVAINDGVDCVPMKPWKAFLVQLLNIAGTGPIFGPLMGAVFGPVVFLWIVLGSILGGAVHDYMSGMISSRHGGNSIAELSGIYLGNAARWVMRIFSVVLLVLCGVVFVTSPAGLISGLLEQLHAPAWMDTTFWAVVILAYYLLATLLPIDKVIGKLYPVFGVLLVAMAAAVMGGILFSGGKIRSENGGKKAPYLIFAESKRYWNTFEPILDEFEKSCQVYHQRETGTGNLLWRHDRRIRDRSDLGSSRRRFLRCDAGVE